MSKFNHRNFSPARTAICNQLTPKTSILFKRALCVLQSIDVYGGRAGRIVINFFHKRNLCHEKNLCMLNFLCNKIVRNYRM